MGLSAVRDRFSLASINRKPTPQESPAHSFCIPSLYYLNCRMHSYSCHHSSSLSSSLPSNAVSQGFLHIRPAYTHTFCILALLKKAYIESWSGGLPHWIHSSIYTLLSLNSLFTRCVSIYIYIQIFPLWCLGMFRVPCFYPLAIARGQRISRTAATATGMAGPV